MGFRGFWQDMEGFGRVQTGKWTFPGIAFDKNHAKYDRLRVV